jgi:hypothetical protein
VAALGSDGALSRYRLRLSPWIWLLSQARNSRAWQDKSMVEIVDAVFAEYQPQAKWLWSADVRLFMAEATPRSYCCQYRESDFEFVTRLLTEEGLAWRFEEHEDGGRMVLFSDSSRLCAAPQDASSAAGGGIRYHAAGALEKSDSIQYLQASRKLGVAIVTVLSYDYKAKRSVNISVPTKFPIGGKHAQRIEKEWEEIATWWRKLSIPPQAVSRFFDEYVHDSRAWFKLIPGNPDNEKEMHVLLKKQVAMLQDERENNARAERMFRENQKALFRFIGGRRQDASSPRYARRPSAFSAAHTKALDEYARDNKIPRMLTEGREPFELVGIAGRAGYLRFRKVYGGSDSVLISDASTKDDKARLSA